MKKTFFLIAMMFALLINCKAQNTAPFWSLAGNSNATSGSKLGTTTAVNLSLFTNGSEKMRITTSGNVGIGTTTPLSKLHVKGFGSFGGSVTSANATRALNLVDVNAVMRVLRVDAANAPAVELISRTSADGPNVAYWDFYAQPSDASFRIRDRQSGGAGIDRLTILHTSGNVGIGTIAPLAKLHVEPIGNGGGIYAKGNDGIAVQARSFQGIGVYAYSETAYGVRADCPQGTGIKTSGQVYGIEANGEQAGVNCFSTDGVGLTATSTNSSGLIASTSGGTYAAEFYGLVLLNGGYTTSDRNLKQNINEFGDAMSIINKLKPRNYEFKNEAKYEFLHLPKGTHYGLIAQDLEQVLPNLVSEGKHAMRTFKPVTTVSQATGGGLIPIVGQQQPTESINIKAVNYVELIPIVIKAIQEQQSQIEKLSARNGALQNELNDLKSLILKNTNSVSITSATGYLKQNVPNPAKNNTIISYYIPGNTAHAQIRITDIKGDKIKIYNASEGEGEMVIKTGELSAGVYNYTLYLSDKQIDSKQMVVTK